MKPMENDFFAISCRQHTECCQGRGAEDGIRYYQIPIPKDLRDSDQKQSFALPLVAYPDRDEPKQAVRSVGQLPAPESCRSD